MEPKDFTLEVRLLSTPATREFGTDRWSEIPKRTLKMQVNSSDGEFITCNKMIDRLYQKAINDPTVKERSYSAVYNKRSST